MLGFLFIHKLGDEQKKFYWFFGRWLDLLDWFLKLNMEGLSFKALELIKAGN